MSQDIGMATRRKPLGRGHDRQKRAPRPPGFTVTRRELDRLIFCCATGPGATGPYGVVTSGFAGMENDPETTSYPVACALVRLLRAEAFSHPGLFPKETQREVIAAR